MYPPNQPNPPNPSGPVEPTIPASPGFPGAAPAQPPVYQPIYPTAPAQGGGGYGGYGGYGGAASNQPTLPSINQPPQAPHWAPPGVSPAPGGQFHWGRTLAIGAILLAVVMSGVVAITHPQWLSLSGVVKSFSGSPHSSPTALSTTQVHASIPAGALLYSAAAPGDCDHNGAIWAQNTQAQQQCTGSALSLSAPNCACPLGLVRLQALPSGESDPDQYVAQIQAQSIGPADGDYFGFKFRQPQPLSNGLGRGGYGFLIDRSGDWEFTRYANNGARSILEQGRIAGDVHGRHTLALAVGDGVFSFYLDGGLVATETDQTYSGGQIDLAVEPDATVLYSSFALFARVA